MRMLLIAAAAGLMLAGCTTTETCRAARAAHLALRAASQTGAVPPEGIVIGEVGWAAARSLCANH